MPSTISTTGTTTDPVTTNYASPETTREWVGQHNGAVMDAHVSGNKLTTTYPTATGTKTVVTDRLTGETDTQFKSRHVTDYMGQMLDDPPVH